MAALEAAVLLDSAGEGVDAVKRGEVREVHVVVGVKAVLIFIDVNILFVNFVVVVVVGFQVGVDPVRVGVVVDVAQTEDDVALSGLIALLFGDACEDVH